MEIPVRKENTQCTVIGAEGEENSTICSAAQVLDFSFVYFLRVLIRDHFDGQTHFWCAYKHAYTPSET